ncbi:hypothetical protein E2C01_028279 [Portunus trituberculatus]|uniref:Uncharacterized protein n=1 Tax=Portunus trituberculatus TaxID=210409 RepID=A0A5B7ENR4_PORTR|nr:hypothetical protein [Portunus trituberculatus]
MKALAEPKTKPHHGPRSTSTHHSLSPTPSPGPPRRGSTSTNNSRSSHERSHSDTHAVPVDLSAESSSVTSLSKLHKSHTSGMLLDPAPPPLGTSNAASLSPSSSVATLSFVHAAACSALISSIKKLSAPRNNIAGKPPLNSHHTVFTKRHSPPHSQSPENDRGTSEREFHFLEPVKSVLSPNHSREKRKLKIISKHGMFSQSLPGSGETPSKENHCLVSPCNSKLNINVPSNSIEFQVSTPTCHTAPVVMNSNDSWHRDMLVKATETNTRSQEGFLAKNLAGSLPCLSVSELACQQRKHDGSEFETFCLPGQSIPMKKNPLYCERSVDPISVMPNSSPECGKVSFALPLGKSSPVSQQAKADSAESCRREAISPTNYKHSHSSRSEKFLFRKWPSLSHMSQSAVLQQPDCQDFPHYKDSVLSKKSSKILNKIFRSKSEDFLGVDNQRNYSKDPSSETTLSPVSSHSLFARSSSEDVLDKVTDTPEVKEYCIKNSDQEKVKEPSPAPAWQHKFIKPFHAVFSTDFKSFANLKKKMTRSKSHNFTSEDTELPSRFYLERTNSEQNFQNEMSENKYPTLQKCSCDKETYFPSVPKKSLSGKKCDSQRVYQVNEPSSCKNLILKMKSSKGNSFDQTVSSISPDHQLAKGSGQCTAKPHLTCTDGKLTYVKRSTNHTVKMQNMTKNHTWFEKYQINKTNTHNAQDSKPDNSCECLALNTSDTSSHEGTPQPPGDGPQGNTSLTDTVNFLVKYKSQPEVHKRIADKLTAIIRELEEEINLTTPSRQHPDMNVARTHDLRKPQTSLASLVAKTSSLPSRRPTTLLLQRHMCRTNSAPTLSPIEEVKVPPQSSSGACCESGLPASDCCGLNGIRPVSRTSSSTSKKCHTRMTGYRSKSFEGYQSKQDNTIPFVLHGQQHSLSSLSVAAFPSVPYHAPCHASYHATQLVNREYERQPPSLVLPAPVTYCDEYGNEKEIAYV